MQPREGILTCIRRCALPGAVVAAFVALAPDVHGCQENEESEEREVGEEDLASGALQPGLFLRYSAGEDGAPLFEAVDRIVSHDFGMLSPHELVPPDGILARWSGRLWAPRSTLYELALRAGGGDETEILVDGARVFAPLELERGEHALELRWRHASGPARVQLLWRYAGRGVEIVPHWALSHLARGGGGGARAGDLFERGRRLAERLLCGACHGGEDADDGPPRDRAPGLDGAGHGLRSDWLRSYLLDPSGTEPRSVKRELLRDPRAAPAEAEALIRFLRYGASPATGEKDGPDVPPERGARRFKELGCFTCHPAQDTGESPESPEAAYPGAPLADLSRKMERARLEAILRRPHEVLLSGSMPDFHLVEADVAALADFLMRGGEQGNDVPQAWPPAPDGDSALAHLARAYPGAAKDASSEDGAWVAYGRAVARARRCAACHELPGFPEPAPVARPLAAASPERGCLGEELPDDPAVPAYRLDADERRALRAHVARLGGAYTPAREVRIEREIERLGCFACHARDGGPVPWRLPGEVTQLPKSMHFPDLSGVGAKLRRTWLVDVLAAPADGNRVWRASPARMPDYHLGEQRAGELAEHLARRDRVHLEDAEDPLPVPTVLSGDQLDRLLEDVGRRGFTCFGCHLLPESAVQFGLAYDAIGPDLSRSGERLRQEWVLDWLRDPALTHPTTRMPTIGDPADDALRERLWSYLVAGLPHAEDALRWEAPLEAGSDGPVFVHALVKRDEAMGLSMHHPRSLLVLLENGAAALFDVDRLATVAFWSRGAFSYRVHGRSRYWTPLAPADWAGEDVQSGLSLVDREGVLQRARLGPTLGRMPSRLVGFDVLEHGLAVHYRLEDERGVALVITESYTPAAVGSAVGLDRSLVIEGIPAGERVAIATCLAAAASPTLVTVAGGGSAPLTTRGVAARGARLVSAGSAGRRLARELVKTLAPSATWRLGSCGGGTQDATHPAIVLVLDPGGGSAVSVVERILALPERDEIDDGKR